MAHWDTVGPSVWAVVQRYPQHQRRDQRQEGPKVETSFPK